MKLPVLDAVPPRLRPHGVGEAGCRRAERHLRTQGILGDQQVALGVFKAVTAGDEVQPIGKGNGERDVSAALQVTVIDGIRRLQFRLRLLPIVAIGLDLKLRVAAHVLLQLEKVAFARLDPGVRRKP